MKQTAVEWLFEQLWEEPKDKLTWYSILEQAKKLEKQQIKAKSERQAMCDCSPLEEPKQETLEDELWGNVFAKIKQYGLNNEVLIILKQNFNISKR